MAREVTEFITPATTDDLPEGVSNKYDTGAPPADLDALPDGSTRFAAAETGATADQTASEIQTSLLGQADADIGFVTSTPLTGEKKIYGVHINAAGNIEADNESIPEA